MEDKLPSFTEIYRALIVISSTGTTEEAPDWSSADLITLLADWFKDSGFSMEAQPVPGIRSKFNILAGCEQGAGDLLLVGHTNMVPFDDGHWTRDPFTLAEHGGKPYGLGTADMRGFFMFILDALHDVDVTKLAKPFYILMAADEETGMTGACYFAETTTLRPDCAVIGKPTSLQPVCVHKGHTSNAIRIQDQSNHSGDPARGVNAIELVHDVIERISQLRDNLKERYHYDAFTVPYPTLSLGHTHGDDTPNRICACCELHVDIRPLLGMIPSEFNGLLNDALAPVSERWPGCLTVDELYPSIPDHECPPNYKLVEVAERLFGAKTEVVDYRTEVPFI